MMTQHDVPFYSNTPDGTHCFQAAIRMVMKYFEPTKDFTWAELDVISAKIEGMWTWPSAGLIWMQDHGYELHDTELFDYERLATEGGDYLISEFGEEVGRKQIAHSDMNQEKRLAAEYLKKVKVRRRQPELAEIDRYVAAGFLVISNVNSRVLNNREGFSGHFVVITGFDDKNLQMHDPGLPPHEARLVAKSRFDEAWAYPNVKAKNYVAIRLKTNEE